MAVIKGDWECCWWKEPSAVCVTQGWCRLGTRWRRSRSTSCGLLFRTSKSPGSVATANSCYLPAAVIRNWGRLWDTDYKEPIKLHLFCFIYSIAPDCSCFHYIYPSRMWLLILQADLSLWVFTVNDTHIAAVWITWSCYQSCINLTRSSLGFI